ncbi:unnamed protein product, partial [marine sediment metagenome]
MNNKGHRTLVTLALDAMPKRQSEFWEALRPEILRAYPWPDTYAIQLLRNQRGPWRRYFPAKQLKYNFEQSGRTVRSFLPESSFYVKNVIQNLRQGDLLEAARFAGVYSHYIADFAEPAHYYELDIGRLLPPPADRLNCEYHRMIEDIDCTVESMCYRPRLLGFSEGEMIFRLESRFNSLYALSVATVIPM